MKPATFSQLLGLAACFSCPALAQTASVDQREVLVPVVRAGNPDLLSYGDIRSVPNTTSGNAILEWRYVPPTDPDIDPVAHPLTLPMHRVGDVMRLAENEYLVVGRRHTTAPQFVGHVARVQLDFNSTTLSLVSSSDIGPIDPVDICHDSTSGRLFIIDALQRRLVSSPWSGGALPSSFSTVFGYSQLGSLARIEHARLAARPGVAGVYVVDSNGVERTFCYSANGQWQMDNASWLAGLSKPAVTAATRFVPVNRPWNLGVFGPATFPLSATVRSEQQPDVPISLSGPSCQVTPLPASATPGSFGTLMVANGSWFDFRTCVRYGEPQNTAFYPLGEAFCDLYGPYAARENFLCGVELLPHAVNGVGAAPAVSGELRIGFRGANGVDPVTISGSSATLTPLLTVPFALAGGTLPRDISFAFPLIPPELANSVVLLQVMVTDGVQVAQSDVFGLQIRTEDAWTEHDGF